MGLYHPSSQTACPCCNGVLRGDNIRTAYDSQIVSRTMPIHSRVCKIFKNHMSISPMNHHNTLDVHANDRPPARLSQHELEDYVSKEDLDAFKAYRKYRKMFDAAGLRPRRFGRQGRHTEGFSRGMTWSGPPGQPRIGSTAQETSIDKARDNTKNVGNPPTNLDLTPSAERSSDF